MIQLMFSRRWWWTTLLVLFGVVLTIRLGIWQLDRLSQRREANAHIEAMQAAPVFNLSGEAFPNTLFEMEYRSISATGNYDFDHQIAIRNQVWTQSWGDDLGFSLFTPLILDNGKAVLVERGWIPAKYTTSQSWRQFDEAGTITVRGIIRLPLETPEMGGGVPDPTLAPGQSHLDIWNLVNIKRIQGQIPYPLLPIYIQQAPDAAHTSLPYRSLPDVDLSDGPHLGYAIQWFFYGSLLLFGYPVYLRKQKIETID